MSDERSGPKAGFEGVVEDVKGKAKEFVGTLTGDERKKDEGRAQQDKADAEREVARREAQAEASRAEAETHEKRQAAEQR